jgi:hypothetical protein
MKDSIPNSMIKVNHVATHKLLLFLHSFAAAYYIATCRSSSKIHPLGSCTKQRQQYPLLRRDCLHLIILVQKESPPFLGDRTDLPA